MHADGEDNTKQQRGFVAALSTLKRRAAVAVKDASAVSLRSGLLPAPGIVVGTIVALLSGALFLLSSAPWAGNMYLPHNPILDTLYKWLDPFLLYTGTGWLFVFLIVHSKFGVRMLSDEQPKLLYSLILSFLFFVLMTIGLNLLSTVVLKPGFARLRPRSRLEHSLIAAALSGRVSKADCACLPATTSQCPIGQAVIECSQRADLGWPPADSTTLELVVDKFRSREEAAEHLEAIYAGVGTGPWIRCIKINLYELVEIAKWQEKSYSPFLTAAIFGEEEQCKIPDSCPSDHVLRQAMVFFLSVTVVFFRWPRISYLRRHPRIRWFLLLLSTITLAWCMWGRVYGYRHTWSDEMLSLGAVGGIALVVIAVIETSQARTTFVGKRILERVGLWDLLDSARVMFVYFDSNNKFHIWNKACEYITGYTAAEIQTLDDYVRKLYPSSDLKAMKRRLRQAITERSPSTNVVTRIRTKAEKHKMILWNAAPIIGPAGRVVGKFSIGIEISPLGSRLSNIGFVGPTLLHDFKHDMEVICLHAKKALKGDEGEQDTRVRLTRPKTSECF